jgi:RNA-directed DNA polymerase
LPPERTNPAPISAAPFRDRVVHHALCNVIEPIFERGFVFDSYATRKGKGTHAAVQRFSEYQKRYADVLKLDVEKYFPSIDHAVLKALVRRKIKCADTLALVDLIIDRSNDQEPRNVFFPGDGLFTPFERRRGLPIGNLTSQFFANVYLDPVDHFIQEELRCRAYVRYMDDFCLFSDSKSELREWRTAIEGRLADLRLVAKASKTRIFSSAENIGFLGYRCLRSHRRLERGNVVRALRRLRGLEGRLAALKIEPAEYRASLMSWLGHAKWAATKGLVVGTGICGKRCYE